MADSNVSSGLTVQQWDDKFFTEYLTENRFSGEMNVTVLVDFSNDSVTTALEVADALGDQLWGVRLDTSERLVDRSLWHDMGDFRPTGVNEVLVERVRDALDGAGHERVKIVVSGGFTGARIRDMEPSGPATWRIYTTDDAAPRSIDTYQLFAGVLWHHESTIPTPKAVRVPYELISSGSTCSWPWSRACSRRQPYRAPSKTSIQRLRIRNVSPARAYR